MLIRYVQVIQIREWQVIWRYGWSRVGWQGTNPGLFWIQRAGIGFRLRIHLSFLLVWAHGSRWIFENLNTNSARFSCPFHRDAGDSSQLPKVQLKAQLVPKESSARRFDWLHRYLTKSRIDFTIRRILGSITNRFSSLKAVLRCSSRSVRGEAHLEGLRAVTASKEGTSNHPHSNGFFSDDNRSLFMTALENMPSHVSCSFFLNLLMWDSNYAPCNLLWLSKKCLGANFLTPFPRAVVYVPSPILLLIQFHMPLLHFCNHCDFVESFKVNVVMYLFI